jgi:hypothetical protein
MRGNPDARNDPFASGPVNQDIVRRTQECRLSSDSPIGRACGNSGRASDQRAVAMIAEGPLAPCGLSRIE